MMRYDFKEREIMFSVQDTGIGIKQSEREKLFKMFGKLDSTKNLNTSGVGIGLFICKKIVEVFGGRI